jgi:hypothetical protein
MRVLVPPRPPLHAGDVFAAVSSHEREADHSHQMLGFGISGALLPLPPTPSWHIY